MEDESNGPPAGYFVPISSAAAWTLLRMNSRRSGLRVMGDSSADSGTRRNRSGFPIWTPPGELIVHRNRSQCNWQEMCFVNDLFRTEDETVIQFHPPGAASVNFHPHLLHLWKRVGVEIETPPVELVGPIAVAEAG